MATKKPKLPDMPTECCGVCTFSHLVDAQLCCFADRAIMIREADGSINTERGIPVENHDWICIDFKPRLNS